MKIAYLIFAGILMTIAMYIGQYQLAVVCGMMGFIVASA